MLEASQGNSKQQPASCSRRVADLCDRTLPQLAAGRQREQVRFARERLEKPLQVAVAGRVKAGKSTLVNALVGQSIAPTAVEECTKVVTSFSFGVPERVEIRLRDGGSQVLALEDGRIPDPLGPAVADVASVEVFLSQRALERLTLIDTPGVSSANEEFSRRTEALLMDRDSRTAAEGADALIFLMGQGARQDDAEVLDSFNALFRGAHASPATAVGVLSRADQMGDEDGDPLLVAQRVAARQAEVLRTLSSTVIPMAGLLAQTAEAQLLTERDLGALRTLAELGPAARSRMLFSHESFLAMDAPVEDAQRRRLVALLDLFGIVRALELTDSGVSGVSDLEQGLRELSGIGRLRKLIEETFARRADALKASAALTALTQIAWERPEPGNERALDELRNAVEDIRFEPEMRSIAEIWAGQAATADDVYLSPERLEDLLRLTTRESVAERLGLGAGAGPEEIAAAARSGAARWRGFANSGAASAMEERIARVVYRSFERMAAERVPREADVDRLPGGPC